MEDINHVELIIVEKKLIVKWLSKLLGIILCYRFEMVFELLPS